MAYKCINKKTLCITLAFVAAWLYIMPLLYVIIFPNADTPNKSVALVEKKLHQQEKDFELLFKNTPLLLALVTNQYTLAQAQILANKTYSVQLYEQVADSAFTLNYWNNNIALPSNAELCYNNGSYAISKDNGFYLYIKKSLTLNTKKYALTALITIYKQYFIETKNLKNEFVANTAISNKYTISTTPTIYAIKATNGTIISYLDVKNDIQQPSNIIYSICRGLMIVLLLIISYLISAIYAHKLGSTKSLLLLVILYTLTGTLIVTTTLLINTSAVDYFQQYLYTADIVVSSMPMLTLFLIMLVGIITFCHNYYPTNFFNIPTKLGVTYARVVLFCVLTFYISWLVRCLVLQSTISYNVTNFFTLNIYSVLGLLHAAALLLLYHIIILRIINVRLLFTQLSYKLFIAIAGISLLLLFANFYWASHAICILILVWSMLYVALILLLHKGKPAAVTRQLNIIWLFILAASGSVLFQYEISKRELDIRKQFGEKLAFQSDPSTENLLRIATAKFNDAYLLLNLGKLYNDTAITVLKNTMLSENFIGYLNKFETKIFTYDSLEKPLFNNDSTSFQTFNAIIQNQAKPVIAVPHLYFYETDFDVFRYLYYKKIIDTNGSVKGYFVIQANPLSYKNKSAALSPELFKQRNTTLEDNGNEYTYAMYSNLMLRRRYINDDIPTQITVGQIPISKDTLKYNNGYSELWMKINNKSVVIISKKQNTLIILITLFAYLFFALLLIVFLVSMFNLLYQQKLNIAYIKQLAQLSFAKQVQGIIWLVSLITFIIIAWVIISLFKTRFTKANKERLGRTMSILAADVQNKLNNNALFDDVVRVYEPGVNQALTQSVYQLSEIHNVDFNIYDLDGTLKISSQPFIVGKGVISNKMNALAYYNLTKKTSAQYVQQETIGNSAYLSMYVPIRDDAGRQYGYLNIPYYSSQLDLNQEISNFLITIINLNAFIFLVAGLIAWLVTSRITKSFALIGSKMKNLKLGTNEVIAWKYNDEIGRLVTEYNKMVLTLNASAVTLAKSERESAWREMARQVAHEIKNPLTPIKLNLQYLQMAIANNDANVPQLTTKVSNTIIQQIDHLSTIASDFSQFANIGNVTNTEVDVAKVLEGLQNLFNAYNTTYVNLAVNAINTIILADATQVNRLYTNIIKNAEQAYTPDTNPKVIDIAISTTNSHIKTTITDYGNGIAPEAQHKLFTPNFTTKTSGTGLGLAMVKGIVEQSQGTITFNTALGVGTTFTIIFPLYNPNSNK